MKLSKILKEIAALKNQLSSSEAKKKFQKIIDKRREVINDVSDRNITTYTDLQKQLKDFIALDKAAEKHPEYFQALAILELKLALSIEINRDQDQEINAELSTKIIELVFSAEANNVWQAYQAVSEQEHEGAVSQYLQQIAPRFLSSGLSKYEAAKDTVFQSIQHMDKGFLQNILNTNVDSTADLQKSLDAESELKKAEFKMLCLLQDYVNKRRDEEQGMVTSILASVGLYTSRTKENKLLSAQSVQQSLVAGGLQAAITKATEVMTQGRSIELKDTLVSLGGKYGVAKAAEADVEADVSVSPSPAC